MVQKQIKITLLRSAEANIIRSIQLAILRKKQLAILRKNQLAILRKNQLNATRKKQLDNAKNEKTVKLDLETPMFYFIHNYKTLGTTIYSQLTNHYKKRYYGHKTFLDWERDNSPLKINKKALELSPFSYRKPVSIDHILLDQLIDLNILPRQHLPKTSFVMIVREPIERFISICNFHDTSPAQIIDNLKNNVGDNFFQFKLLNNTHDIKVKTIKMINPTGIVDWFNKFNVKMDLTKRLNVSIKKYTISDLKPEELDFLKQFYIEDMKLYEESE